MGKLAHRHASWGKNSPAEAPHEAGPNACHLLDAVGEALGAEGPRDGGGLEESDP